MTVEAVWLISGIFVASGISGMTGVGFPTVATPLFMLVFDPIRTVALTALCSLTGQVISMISLRRDIAYTVRWPLVLAGITAVPVGLALLSVIDKHVFGAIAGAVVAGASAWWLCKPGVRLTTQHPAVEVLAGLAGGLCGGLTGVSAPIPTIWCAACGMTKERQRAVMQPFILIIQLSSGILLWQRNAIDHVVMQNYALLIGPVICGSWLGTRVFRAFTHQAFVRVAMGVTAAGGLALMFK
ncbi:MAG: sulfite exporter TauE/SafE family protein [Acetobacteraceae bacterium]|jgi:uncharacterized membrane protein YfcA